MKTFLFCSANLTDCFFAAESEDNLTDCFFTAESEEIGFFTTVRK